MFRLETFDAKSFFFLKNSVLVLERYLVAARLFFLPHAFFISLLIFHWLEKHGWRFLLSATGHACSIFVLYADAA